MISIDVRRQYDEMFSTFESDGWALIRERFVEAYTLQNDLSIIGDEKSLYKAQGRLITLSQFINLPELIKAEYEKAVEDSEDNGENELEK